MRYFVMIVLFLGSAFCASNAQAQPLLEELEDINGFLNACNISIDNAEDSVLQGVEVSLLCTRQVERGYAVALAQEFVDFLYAPKKYVLVRSSPNEQRGFCYPDGDLWEFLLASPV